MKLQKTYVALYRDRELVHFAQYYLFWLTEFQLTGVVPSHTWRGGVKIEPCTFCMQSSSLTTELQPLFCGLPSLVPTDYKQASVGLRTYLWDLRPASIPARVQEHACPWQYKNSHMSKCFLPLETSLRKPIVSASTIVMCMELRKDACRNATNVTCIFTLKSEDAHSKASPNK